MIKNTCANSSIKCAVTLLNLIEFVYDIAQKMRELNAFPAAIHWFPHDTMVTRQHSTFYSFTLKDFLFLKQIQKWVNFIWNLATSTRRLIRKSHCFRSLCLNHFILLKENSWMVFIKQRENLLKAKIISFKFLTPPLTELDTRFVLNKILFIIQPS